MPCKMVILAPRKADLTHEECIEYMTEEHAPLVEQFPGLKRYTSSIPSNPEEVGYDYVAQLWFDSPGDMNDAFESEVGAAVQRDATNFVDVGEIRMFPAGDETTHFETSE